MATENIMSFKEELNSDYWSMLIPDFEPNLIPSLTNDSSEDLQGNPPQDEKSKWL